MISSDVLHSLKDIDASVAAVAKREPLIKVPVERERFEATLKDEMNHPEIAKIGLGNVDPVRLKNSIDILVDANALPRTPTVEEIFTGAFLPPANLPVGLPLSLNLDTALADGQDAGVQPEAATLSLLNVIADEDGNAVASRVYEGLLTTLDGD